MTVAELDEKMSAREFFEWYEYAKKEPLIADRLETMLASLSSIIYNSNSKKHLQAIDFLVSLDEETKESIKMEKLHKDLFNDIDKLKRG